MFDFNIRSSQQEITEVSTDVRCIHCGKPDWCYSIGELTACKRGADPASGWEITGKSDKDGTPYYAPAAPKKAIRAKSRKEYFYHDRNGEPLIKVMRIDDGNGKKSFPQYHWNGQRWIKGVPAEIQKQVPIYRYQQVRKAIASDKTVFMVEGEGCADTLWNVGICATTTLGGSGKYKSYGSYQEDLAGADLVLCPDRDEPGVKHMEVIASDFPNAQWLYAPPNDFYWQRLPKSQGLDVGDWLNDGATADDIRAAVTKQKFCLPSKPYIESTDAEILDEEPLTAPMADEVFTQKAIDALYSNTRWISIDSKLYRWTGTHFKAVSQASEKARIAGWCNSTAVQSGSNTWTYAYAKNHIVDGIYNWLLVSCGIDPEVVNPPGLNCLNGVLNIRWQGKQPIWELVPHDPEVIYTYVGEFEFDPNADPQACDRLLSCLEPDQQQIFLRTLAASLDLKKIRSFKGQRIKALLCKGDGNNGKDSLKEAVQCVYGVGVVSTTMSDFHQYDHNGRKFALAKLEHARVSWSSENSNLNQLDNLQSLKAAITGETLDLELKGVQERPMTPNAVFFFNINNIPNLQASLEAIESRYAVLSFNKTFKMNADPVKGEIEADSRFRYDPDFIRREVVPALLNKMLAVLPEVATQAIDYSSTETALQEIQRDTNHLQAFCQDLGLDSQIGGRIYINDLWEKLRDWYIANGTLNIIVDDKGKEKAEWHEQPRRNDKNVKASNQVYQRFSELFPKATKQRDYSHGDCHGLFYLAGIGFGSPVGSPVGSPMDQQQSLQGAVDHHGSPISPTLSHALELIGKLTPIEREFLVCRLKEAQLVIHGDPRLYERVTADPTGDPTGDPVVIHKSVLANSANSSDTSMKRVKAVLGSNIVGGIGNVAHDSSTKNFPPTSVSDLKKGDRVVNVNSTKVAENWRGTIVKLRDDGRFDVEWDERSNNKGKRRVYPHPKCDLQRVEDDL